MSHPAVDNKTGFAFEPAFLNDEENRPLLVPIVKATFRIPESGELILAEEQPPVRYAGIFNGLPDTSSYRYEPEGVFVKPATDCVLIGHAHAPHASATHVDVGLRIGPVGKVVRVFGDRCWYKSLGSVVMTPPAAFDKIPLLFERAFGGWDRQHRNPSRHAFDARNPVGIGFRERWHFGEEVVPVPNLEHPQHPIGSFGDRPPPAAFGFVSPHWTPRAAHAGTYDAAWARNRMPRLPVDFNRLFFNGASPGLLLPGRLRGDEPVRILGASPHGQVDFRLPGVPPPTVDIELRRKRKETLQTELDTVIVDMDERIVTLLWRAHLPIRDVPHGIAAIAVSVSMPLALHLAA
jgi:hypothetical protein